MANPGLGLSLVLKSVQPQAPWVLVSIRFLGSGLG